MKISVSFSQGAEEPADSRPVSLWDGIKEHARGNLDQARAYFAQALREQPARALTAYNLGVAYVDTGMGGAAVPFLLRATLLDPDCTAFAEGLLYARLRTGNLDALDALLSEYEQRGRAVATHRWRGWLHRARAGDRTVASAVAAPGPLRPMDIVESPSRLSDLAIETPAHAKLSEPFARVLTLYEEDRNRELEAELASLLRQYPDWGEGQDLYGLALIRLGRVREARVAFRRATALLGGRPEVHAHLALALSLLEDYGAAFRAYERALAMDPLRATSWNNAAAAALSAERHTIGYQLAFVAVSLDPTDEAHVMNLARAAKGIGKLDLARKLLQRVVQAQPKHALAHQQLGELAMLAGDNVAAKGHFARALDSNPADTRVLSSLVFMANYEGAETAADLYARARQFAAALQAQCGPARTSWPNLTNPGRRPLRVGFVSGDLRAHPVGYFFAAVSQALSASPNLELFGYPTTLHSDFVTDQIKASFHHWTPIAGLDDQQASRRVASDRIDILLDLSGHTAKNRLGVFALKPAPVQATWLGYFGTTGLPQIDYLLAGPWDVAPTEEPYYSETIWRLPATRLCFSRPQVELAPNAPPSTRQGQITFGCFNNLRKLNDRVIRLWARILADLSDARLFLKAAELDSAEVCDGMLQRFQVAGIDAGRLLLQGRSPFEEYMQAYHDVDIALDPFPYTGATTTMQALWMGVPVLTLAGDRLLARQSEAMLRALDMTDWVAESESDYVAKALAHASDVTALDALRRELRGRIEDSPLMSASRFAAQLETAFAEIWRSRCEGTDLDRAQQH